MPDPRPTVSVIVPVYNGAEFLFAAIESVVAQAYAPLEIVVVDDGSTDGSAELAASFDGVHVVRQPNAGPSAARNAGLTHSSGTLIAFLDSDDLWPAGRLARLVPLLERDPALDAVLCQLQMFTERGGARERLMAPQFGFQFGAALIRRSAFDTVGPIDPAVRLSEDVDWFMRARDAGIRVARLPEPLYLYRQHEESVTAGIDPGDDFGIAAAIKRSLDRRRAAGTSEPAPLPEIS